MPQPRQWGPSTWKALHWVAAQYPLLPREEDRKHYATFFESLQHVLPCTYCRHHYTRTIRNNPVQHHLDSREELSFWLWELHNRVNLRTHKPQVPYHVITRDYGVAYPPQQQRKEAKYVASNSTRNDVGDLARPLWPHASVFIIDHASSSRKATSGHVAVSK